MTDTDKKDIPKGVHDPWRIGTPEWTPPPSEQKLDRSRHRKRQDLGADADLSPERRCLLRMPGQSGALLILGTRDPGAAAERVMRAIDETVELQQLLRQAKFVWGPKDQMAPQGFYFAGETGLITHEQASPEVFVLLVQMFLRFNRTAQGRETLKRFGIRPLIAGS